MRTPVGMSVGTPVSRSHEYHTKQLGNALIWSMMTLIAGTRQLRV